MTTLDVKKKWSFQIGGHSRQVQFAWNPVEDRNIQKLENDLFRQGGLSRGVVPGRFYCRVYMPVHIREEIKLWTKKVSRK